MIPTTPSIARKGLEATLYNVPLESFEELPEEKAPICIYNADRIRKMSELGLGLRCFINNENGFRATEKFRLGLVPKLDEIFSSEGRAIYESYPHLRTWDNFVYMVSLTDLDDVFNPQNGNYDSLKGVVLGFLLRTNKGTPYVYLCKVGITEELQKNGFMRPMLHVADQLNHYIRRKFFPNAKADVVCGLRTFKPEKDKQYSNMSDKRLVRGEYFMHFFGLYDQKTQEIYGKHLDDIADHMASLPKTVKDLR